MYQHCLEMLLRVGEVYNFTLLSARDHMSEEPIS